MCEHYMDNLPFTKQKHCRHCGKSEQEIALETALAAANARVADLEGQVNRLHKCLIFDGECIGKYQTDNKRMREALEFLADYELCHDYSVCDAMEIAKAALEGKP